MNFSLGYRFFASTRRIAIEEIAAWHAEERPRRFPGPASAPCGERVSVVECRPQLQRVGLCLVMIDKQLGVVGCDHPPDLVHGGD
jgi:hypothetical protein